MTTSAGAVEGTLTAVPVRVRDGFEVHQACLRRGLATRLYPRQVMEAQDSGGRSMTFVHGIPSSTDIAAATCSTDLVLLRKLLLFAGLPLPEGKDFRLDRAKGAFRFAGDVGYPVVIRPALGDRPNDVRADLANKRDLARAIDYLMRPETERPGHSKAAYELTLLPEPTEDGERRVSPGQYRFAIDQQVEGHHLRVLVVEDRALSVVVQGAPFEQPGARDARDVSEECHASVATLAVKALHAVPGLFTGAIDLVVEDWSRDVQGQRHYVTGLSARLRLAVQAEVGEHLSAELASEVLEAHAALVGVPLSSSSDTVDVKFKAHEASDAAVTAARVGEALESVGIDGAVTEVDEAHGTFSGYLKGSPWIAALVLELIADTDRPEWHATYVESWPAEREYASLL